MNAHYDCHRDQEAASRQAAWTAEWDLQFALLPKATQEAVQADPMHPAADYLDELVEKILCERGEL